MIHSKKLTLKAISQILAGTAPITITRIAKADTTFPELERIGRSIFIDRDEFYDWLSVKAGFNVKSPDIALTSKDLQRIYQKSHTWVWQGVKSGALPVPFKINNFTFWMQSQNDDFVEVAA